MIYILISIDWELDFGAWDWDKRSGAPDYGGILVGTPYVEKMLDDLEIPCTWFVESHCQLEERDTIRIVDPVVKSIARRPLDEIGVHIHWSRRESNGKICYPVKDCGWVSKQLQHAKTSFANLNLRTEAFRGGAFLGVQGLPRLLQQSGFSIDSSVLWDRSNSIRNNKITDRKFNLPIRIAKRNLGKIPKPYYCSSENAEAAGKSQIVEFPVNFSLLSLLNPMYLFAHSIFLSRIKKSQGSEFLVLFFHIGEVTDPMTGPNEFTKIRFDVLERMSQLLYTFKKSETTKFVTFSEAKKIFANISLI
jgi:hypothetical protein